MKQNWATHGLGILLASGIIATLAWAETVELATYYPAASGSSSDRLHASRMTIGAPYSLANPAEPNPLDGTLLVGKKVGIGIGVGTPESALAVQGSGTSSATSGLNVTNSAGTSALFVRDDGKVGIGTATPESALAVQGPGTSSATSGLNVTNSAGTSALFVQDDGNIGAGMTTPTVRLDVAPQGAIRVGNAYLSSGEPQFGIFSFNSWYRGAAAGGWKIPNLTSRSAALVLNNAALEFYQTQTPGATDWVQRLGISPAGNATITSGSSATYALLLRNAANGSQLGIDDNGLTKSAVILGTNQGLPGAFLQLTRDNTVVDRIWQLVASDAVSDYSFGIAHPGQSALLFIQRNGNVGIGTQVPGYKLDVAGEVHATGFPTSSDARFKSQVTPLTGVLEKLDKVQGISFEWNELYQSLGRASGHKEIGVIAQELEQVFPELVTRWGEEGYRAVDYGRLTTVLLEAVKELKGQNDSLRKETEGLREEIKAIRKAIEP